MEAQAQATLPKARSDFVQLLADSLDGFHGREALDGPGWTDHVGQVEPMCLINDPRQLMSQLVSGNVHAAGDQSRLAQRFLSPGRVGVAVPGEFNPRVSHLSYLRDGARKVLSRRFAKG